MTSVKLSTIASKTKTVKMITNSSIKKIFNPSTSGNNMNNNNISGNSRKIVEQVTNYINFLEIEQNTSNDKRKRDDTQSSNDKQKLNKSKFSGRRVLQQKKNKNGTASEATNTNDKNSSNISNCSNFNRNHHNLSQSKPEKSQSRKVPQQDETRQQRNKLLSLNHSRICTCTTSNDDDKTAICEAHAKFNKHFSIDFLLKHPPPQV